MVSASSLMALGILFVALAVCTAMLGSASEVPLRLAEGGQTVYIFLLPANPESVQESAAKELADYLYQATGAKFPVRSISDKDKEQADITRFTGRTVMETGSTSPSARPRWRAKRSY